MKFIWLTDIHLNFLDKQARLSFYQDIRKAKGDALLISGDIAEANSITAILEEMVHEINKPIYFILGNHDYYGGKIDAVHLEIRRLMKRELLVHWLPESGVINVNGNAMLIGQDGWADGRFGKYADSPVVLNDSRMIADLFQEKILGKDALLKKMQQLADNDAKQLQKKLDSAITQYPKKIIIVTHVPPFKEACLYEGKISSDEYLPFFSSKIMGEALLQITEQNPTIEFLVLCGHTHHECLYRPVDNLLIRAGRADYFQPKIQDIIQV